MLTGENISVGYNEKQIVFSSINFSATGGDMVALLGVNGIGKSTLLRTIAGLQKKITGKIELDGKSIDALSAPERAKIISVVLTEKIFIDNITVKNFIALGRSPYSNWLGNLSETDMEEIEKVLFIMKIDKLQNRLFNQLSDGEKQKATIARALCQQTPVMILDEPTAFLDFRNKKEILDLLSSISTEMKKLIICSTHDIEASLKYCNKFWLMTEEKEFIEIKRDENYRDEIMKKLFIES